MGGSKIKNLEHLHFVRKDALLEEENTKRRAQFHSRKDEVKVLKAKLSDGL